MALRCQPAFPSNAQDGTVAEIINGVFAARIVDTRVSSLVRLFQVTDEEARHLQLRIILPDAIKAEREAEKKSRSKEARKGTRQDAIAAHIQAHPQASASDVLKALQSQGFEGSKRTVEREIRELFPNRVKAKAGRKAAQRIEATPIIPPLSLLSHSMSIDFVAIKKAPVLLPFFTAPLKLTPMPMLESTPMPPTPKELESAAEWMEITLSDSKDAHDLRELARLCRDENRSPGQHESQWFARIDAQISKIQEEQYQDFSRTTMRLAA
jgi:hypothetical protein